MPNYPDWIIADVKAKKAGLRASAARATAEDLRAQRLHTVCDEARCPNKGLCFAGGDATFLILGDACTRGCRFCSVDRRKPGPPDPGEPARVAHLCAKWKLKHAVFTSPTRDDLPDGGAAHFAATVRAVKAACPGAGTEPLVPDFAGDMEALETVLEAEPSVLGHNVEMVPSLYGSLRAGADYARSLALLRSASRRAPRTLAKSGLMLGLGETPAELERAINDIAATGCALLTLGQYLAPTRSSCPVARYYTEDEFAYWGEKARKAGFKGVLSGPLVRSSYKAGELYRAAMEAA